MRHNTVYSFYFGFCIFFTSKTVYPPLCIFRYFYLNFIHIIYYFGSTFDNNSM